MRRILVLTAVAVTVGGGIAVGESASAATVCQTEWTTGLITQTKQVCTPTPLDGATCSTQGGGLTGTQDAHVKVCIPN